MEPGDIFVTAFERTCAGCGETVPEGYTVMAMTGDVVLCEGCAGIEDWA